MKTLGVLIGRFQPFHNAHLELVRRALKQCDDLLIILGSANSAPTLRNPFSVADRMQMIRSSLTRNMQNRVYFSSVDDYFYDDAKWCKAVQAEVHTFCDDDNEIRLVSPYKDQTTYYLNLFPTWKQIALKVTDQLSATMVRETLFNPLCGTEDVAPYVPIGVLEWLESYAGSGMRQRMIDEMTAYQQDKRLWADTPYPIITVTADALVFCGEEVLLIERKHAPGKGLLALPGGFVNPGETRRQAAIRELIEETGIDLTPEELDKAIVDEAEFDHPLRSTRHNPTNTRAFVFRLKPEQKAATIRAGDDAARALWRNYNHLMPEVFHDDHYQIIDYFLGITQNDELQPAS